MLSEAHVRRQKAPTWQALGFVLHPPEERMEILMTSERWMSRWWEVSVVANVAAAFWFWMIYPVVLALVVAFSGFAAAKIGPPGPVLDVVA